MDSINTERSYTEYDVTEPTSDFAIGFDNYSGEDKDAIHVTLDGVNLDNLDYTVVRKNAQTIEVTPAIESGVVRLQRETYIDQAFHTFTAGALFSPKSMDENFAQVRRSQQEVNDGFTFLAENTNGVIAAADAATARANAAAELAENTDVTQLQVQLNTQKLDTGITVTAKTGGIDRTQAEKNDDTVSIKDFATPQAAVDYLKSKGGGELYFPYGDYPCRVLIDSPNIKLRGDLGTILRSADTSAIVDVAEGGLNFELDGFDIRGQNLATEGASNANNTVTNTNSLHCIRIREKGARLKNFKTSAARYDGLYVDYDGEVDLEVENFYIGSTARNPLSWIAGQKAKFKNGHFFLDNKYSSVQGVMVAGLYLVDFEPNSVADQYRDIVFENVSFESANPTIGANYLILQDTNLGDANSLDIYLKDCTFLENNGIKAGIRLKADTPLKTFTGLNLDNVKFPARAAYILSGTEITLKDSAWRNVRIGDPSLTFAVVFGSGCTLENIKTTSSTAGTVNQVAGAVRLTNVFSLADHNPSASTVAGELIVASKFTFKGDMRGENFGIFNKAISVSDTAAYTSILTLGNRGTFKVTITGADATAGARAEHISESWVVVSNDYASQVQPIFILNSATTGLDVKWSSGSGYVPASKTLQVKARESASNQFVVVVEAYGGNTTSTPPVTWLV